MTNANCDGSGPCTPGLVRVLPLAGNEVLYLCYRCYVREMVWRRLRNADLSLEAIYDVPSYGSLARPKR
jgi:hypothetical protein